MNNLKTLSSIINYFTHSTNSTVYCDNAATTQIDVSVVKIMQQYSVHNYANPDGLHVLSRNTHSIIEQCRKTVSGLLHAQDHSIVFTRGGTESNVLVIRGIIEHYLDTNSDVVPHVILSVIEHSSVRNTVYYYRDQGKCTVTELPIDALGCVNVKPLRQCITKSTILICVQMVNNEIGTIQPIREISRCVHEYKQSHGKSRQDYPYVFSDAIQSGAVLPIHIQSLDVDILTMSGSKIHGPKSSGIIGIRRGVHINKTFYGGDQENGLRAGTPDIVQISGFTHALELCYEQMEHTSNSVKKMQLYLIHSLQKHIPGIIVNSSPDVCAPHIVHVSIPNYDSEYAVLFFDTHNVAVASQSACTAKQGNISYVVSALWQNRQESPIEYAHIRISLSRFSKKNDCIRLVQVAKKLMHSSYQRF